MKTLLFFQITKMDRFFTHKQMSVIENYILFTLQVSINFKIALMFKGELTVQAIYFFRQIPYEQLSYEQS